MCRLSSVCLHNLSGWLLTWIHLDDCNIYSSTLHVQNRTDARLTKISCTNTCENKAINKCIWKLGATPKNDDWGQGDWGQSVLALGVCVWGGKIRCLMWSPTLNPTICEFSGPSCTGCPRFHSGLFLHIGLALPVWCSEHRDYCHFMLVKWNPNDILGRHSFSASPTANVAWPVGTSRTSRICKLDCVTSCNWTFSDHIIAFFLWSKYISSLVKICKTTLECILTIFTSEASALTQYCFFVNCTHAILLRF